MNKTIKIFLLSVCALLGLCAQADLLYWRVDETGVSTDEQIAFSYARISVSGSGVAVGTYLQQLDNAGTALGTDVLADTETGLGLDTLAAYADLGEYGSAVYSFAVELYGTEDELLGVSNYVAYNEMLNNFHVYSNMQQGGLNPYVYSAFGAAPEPTGGLLMLLGLGVLALRRKRIVACAAVAAIGLGVSAAPNDALLTFGTPGVDTYADGVRVLNGECYALVWTQDGATFKGLSAACTTLAETDRLVLVAPLAKGGRCPTTVFEIAADTVAQYNGGSFGLYLLDTRVRGENGRIALAPFVHGVPQVVNALGAATEESAAPDTTAASVNNLKAASAVRLGTVGVYTEVASPTITSIRIDGATVTLTVDRMSPAADYFVVPAATPGAAAPALDVKPDAAGTFTFPKPEGAPFFKVIGTRKF